MNMVYLYLHQEYEQFVCLNNSMFKLQIPIYSKSYSPHFLRRFFELNKNAILFHYAKGYIKGISTVHEKVRVQGDDSFSLIVEFHNLEKPIRIRQYIQEFVHYLPEMYAAFQQDGTPNNGSLYPCPLELANYFFDKIQENKEIEFTGTEVLQQTHARIGHLLYKQKLLNIWAHNCAICSIKLPELLRASHAKPWKLSSSSEKTNPYNGLLLCVMHDALFDQGFISFNDHGKILISEKLPVEDYSKYNLNMNMSMSLSPMHKPFMQYHREKIFK
ncbi:HNH endonuclease [Bacillus mycoides]|uniref:HNH endonuclease n=1 Tax=Bacillus mycoides TaxID=1405 RepID=UPI001C02323C|nr:HNH endonuclease [Bacillus mycoides]QWI48291.1 HNH endonuclease [Bacillus mycoides]